MELNISKEQYQDFDFLLPFEGFQDGEELVVKLRPESVFVEALPEHSGEFTVLENILYEFNQYELNENAMKELDRLADHMLANPEIIIELSAHTDCRGGEIYNQLLSEKRAKRAKEYLVDKGIDEKRIAALGYGESRLRNHCIDGLKCDESEHAINRRTEVKVIASN